MLKEDIIDFIYTNNVFQLGTKKFKNGDFSDHSYDFGKIGSGKDLMQLGMLINNIVNDSDFNVIFTSAYNSILIATALLFDCNLCFPSEMIKLGIVKKEKKINKDSSLFLGYKPVKGDKVLLFNDVFTTGESLIEMNNLIKSTGAKVTSAFIIVNQSSDDQFKKIQNTLDFPIKFLISDKEIVNLFDVYFKKSSAAC